MGYGHSSRLHTAKVLRLSFDLPIVVEIVDTEVEINEYLPILDGIRRQRCGRLPRRRAWNGRRGRSAPTGANNHRGMVRRPIASKRVDAGYW